MLSLHRTSTAQESLNGSAVNRRALLGATLGVGGTALLAACGSQGGLQNQKQKRALQKMKRRHPDPANHPPNPQPPKGRYPPPPTEPPKERGGLPQNH